MSKLRSSAIALVLALAAASANAAPATTYFTGQTPCRDVALTFDAEFGTTTSELVQKLEELNVTATFFLLGQSIDGRNAELVKRIATRHQIGNHSYIHPRFSGLTSAQIQAELAKTEALVLQLTGQSTKPYFRPPYGDGVRNQAVLQAVGAAGYSHLVHWSVDTVDWQAGQSSDGVTAAILNGVESVVKKGKDPIVLMHGFPAKTIEGLAGAVPQLRANGYQFVTIAELLDPSARSQREFGGDRYWVQPGDTPAAIAACHNLDPDRLLAYNDLSQLTSGQALAIPYQDEVIVRLNGERLFFPVRTRILGARTMIHVRFVEHLGAQISVDEQGWVTVQHGPKVIQFQPDSDQVLINGLAESLVQPTLLAENRLLVPLSFLISEFGLTLDWKAESLTASLTN